MDPTSGAVQAIVGGPNFAEAQYNLATLHVHGAGVARDRARAVALLRAAAAQGHAKSITLLARFLEEGWDDAPRDPAAARTLYAAAAEAGDCRAQYSLGTLLVEDGRLPEALAWFRRAAAGGPPDMRRAMARRLSARPEAALRDRATAEAALAATRSMREAAGLGLDAPAMADWPDDVDPPGAGHGSAAASSASAD